MNNPFDNCTLHHGEFTANVRNTVGHLKVGDSMAVDTYDQSHNKYRAVLRYVSKSLGMRFTTKACKADQSLWIKRVA